LIRCATVPAARQAGAAARATPVDSPRETMDNRTLARGAAAFRERRTAVPRGILLSSLH